MKRKIGYTGMKRCPDGEIYRFKKGIAKVPGTNLTITLKEFNDGITDTSRHDQT